MANTLSDFFEKELHSIHSSSKQLAEKSSSKFTRHYKEKKFVNKQLEIHHTMVSLLQNPCCDTGCYDAVINKHIEDCQIQRKRERERIEAMEKDYCGILVKVCHYHSLSHS